MGITRTKKLWMSELTKTNDPREIHFGLDQALEAIRELRQGPLKGNDVVFLPLFWAKLKGFSANSYLFTTCFTPFGDELPMWLGYTPDASGLSIGFRPRAIKDMHGRLQQVEYVKPTDSSNITAAVRAVASVFPETKGLRDDEFWLVAISMLYSKISSCKHSSWAYEREVRLCFSEQQERLGDVQPVSEVRGRNVVVWVEPKFRSRGEETIPYIEMPFGKLAGDAHDPTRAIENVILGPKCKMTVLDVQVHLTEEGYRDFSVSVSDCRVR